MNQNSDVENGQEDSASNEAARISATKNDASNISKLESSGREELGLLSLGAKQIFVSLLPSQAESVMVKYMPEIQISCVIPPQNFDINYSARRTTKEVLSVTTPTLIMSCGYGEVPSTRNYDAGNGGYSLWAINTEKKDKIYAKPYVFANVFQDGRVCFGRLSPKSLRQAFNQYWTSSFNHDLYRENHVCDKKQHTYHYHNGHKCNPALKKHICDCPKVTFHKHYGCGCTSVGASKACRGSCQSEFANTCDCCQAINAVYAAAREENPDISVRQLAKLATKEGTTYPGCGCDSRHKRGCLCSKNRCNCECSCPCCTNTCEHTQCECSCCLNTCNCQCSCSQEQRFLYHVRTYHDEFLPKQKWLDRTNMFCGTKFWASPKGATGVLICNERLLLNQIPRKFWRKDTNGHPMIIAIADCKDDTWTFESGNFSFSLRAGNILAR